MGFNYDVYVGVEAALIAVNCIVFGVAYIPGIIIFVYRKEWRGPLHVFLLPVTIYIGGVTFIAVFLYETTAICDEKLDCYPFNRTTNAFQRGLPLQKDPITNCSEFDDMEDVVVDCYTFVLKYAEGLGAAGGVVTIATLIFHFIQRTTKRVFKNKKNAKCYKRIIGTIYALVIITLYYISLSVTPLYNIFYRKRNQIWIHLAYMMAFTAPIIPLCCLNLKVDEENEGKSRMNRAHNRGKDEEMRQE